MPVASRPESLRFERIDASAATALLRIAGFEWEDAPELVVDGGTEVRRVRALRSAPGSALAYMVGRDLLDHTEVTFALDCRGGRVALPEPGARVAEPAPRATAWSEGIGELADHLEQAARSVREAEHERDEALAGRDAAQAELRAMRTAAAGDELEDLRLRAGLLAARVTEIEAVRCARELELEESRAACDAARRETLEAAANRDAVVADAARLRDEITQLRAECDATRAEIDEREAELQLARAEAARANDRLARLIIDAELDSRERVDDGDLKVRQFAEQLDGPRPPLEPEPFRPRVPDYSAVSIPPPGARKEKRGLLRR